MIVSLGQKLDSLLNELGFFSLEQGISDLRDQAREMANCAGTEAPVDGFHRFEAFPSYIPFKPADSRVDGILAIDIGGTSTKTGIRLIENGKVHWSVLFETRNDECESVARELGGNSFESFSAALARSIKNAFDCSGISLKQVNRAGVVWSNALKNKLFAHGVTGIIEQREAYRKGEWFVEDLANGVDIGEILLKSFREASLPIEKLLISNDTPFTFTALDNADAGMVASTGLNGTLVKRLDEIGEKSDLEVVCNAEIGGRMRLPVSLLSEADKVDTVERCTIEYLTTGKFLPRVFANYVEVLAREGLDELQPIAALLDRPSDEREIFFRMRHLSSLLQNGERFAREKPECCTSEEALILLAGLAERLICRSAQLCAVVAYATVANRLGSKERFTVALDSRLAREIPFFWQELQRSLSEISPPGVLVIPELLDSIQLSSGRISVPMQGAANALDRI